MSRKLNQQVESGKKVLQGLEDLGIATDKAWVGSLPLQASLLVVPSGWGVVACPQARSSVQKSDHHPGQRSMRTGQNSL